MHARFRTMVASAVVVAVAMMGGWHQSPAAPPAVKPPAREKLQRAEDIYKPTKVNSRAPEAYENPVPAAPASEAPVQPDGAAAAEPDADVAPAAPALPAPPVANAAPAGTAPAIAIAPATPLSPSDIAVLGVLALVVLVPLVLGVWWIVASRQEHGPDHAPPGM